MLTLSTVYFLFQFPVSAELANCLQKHTAQCEFLILTVNILQKCYLLWHSYKPSYLGKFVNSETEAKFPLVFLSRTCSKKRREWAGYIARVNSRTALNILASSLYIGFLGGQLTLTDHPWFSCTKHEEINWGGRMRNTSQTFVSWNGEVNRSTSGAHSHKDNNEACSY